MEDVNMLKRQPDSQREAYSDGFAGGGKEDPPKTATAAQLAARKIKQPRGYMQRHSRAGSPSQPASGGTMSNPFANLNPNALANGQQATNTNGGFNFANTNGAFNFGATSASFGNTSNSLGATSNGTTSNLFGTTTNSLGTTSNGATSNLFGNTSDSLGPTSNGTTSNLFGTANDSLGTTNNGATSNLFGTTSNSLGTTNNSTTSNLFGTTSSSLGTTNNSLGTTSNLFGTPSSSLGTTNNSVGATSNSLNTTSKSVETTSNSLGATSNPFGATSNAFGATSNSFGATSNPFGATSNPFGATSTSFNFGNTNGEFKFGAATNASNNESAGTPEMQAEPPSIFKPAVTPTPAKASSVFDNMSKPASPFKFGSSPEKPSSDDAVNNEAADTAETEAQPSPEAQPAASASPPKASSVFDNVWKPAGPIKFGSSPEKATPDESVNNEAAENAEKKIEPPSIFKPVAPASPPKTASVFGNVFKPTERIVFGSGSEAPTPVAPTAQEAAGEAKPVSATSNFFADAFKSVESTPASAVTPTLKGKEKANEPVAAVTPTPKGKEKVNEPVDVQTFKPTNLPSYLNDDGRKQVERAFKLRALNVEFKKRMAKVDPASSDLDALVRFYVACRENIGQSLGLYERVTAGSKRKAEPSSDRPDESAETPKRARMTDGSDSAPTPVSQPVSQPVPSTASTSPTPTPQPGPSTPFFDQTSKTPSVFDHTWRPESPIKFASGSETPTPDDSGNDEAAEEAEKEAQVSLMESRPGEEHEEVLFEARAKLLKWDGEGKDWKSMGVGPFRILKHKETAKVRMVLRSDPNASVILNSAVQKGITYKVGGDGGKGAAIKFADVTSTGSFESRILKVKTPELAQKVSEILEAAKAA